MSLLHAFALILTVLLFLVRQRCAWPGIASGKRRSVRQQVTELDPPAKPLRNPIVECAQNILAQPKFKKDPEIDVDNEEIGFYPLG